MKRHNRVKVVLVSSLLLFICGWGVNDVSAQTTATLSLQPPSQNIGLGDEFDVVVHLESQELMRGYQLEIFFDSSKFEYVSHTNSGIFPSGLSFPIFIIPPATLVNGNKIYPLGEVGIVPVTASGDLVSIRFREISGSSTNYSSEISFGPLRPNRLPDIRFVR